MTGFPLLLDVRDRAVLVIGAGGVGTRRAQALLEAGARVRVVAPRIDDELDGVDYLRREFRESDVDGAWLVVACADDPHVNAAAAAAAEARRIFCVRSDDASAARPGCRLCCAATT